MEVKTKDGLKKIVDVEAGAEVLTHRNRWKEVVGTREKEPEEDLMVIDGIECTPNHEFYVVHEEDVDEVNEENIHEYAEWVRADELTENHYRVEL
jgi:intein/homing endonuclease